MRAPVFLPPPEGEGAKPPCAVPWQDERQAAGIAKAGEDDPAAVAAAIKATPVETVMGPLNWAPNGDLKGFEFGVFQWHADGTSSQVK